jgi:hypothetical protein
VPFKTPGGRVYVFYTYNKANLREVPNAQSPGVAKRVDTLGVYAFKYSDDHGRTWSKERYEIPMHVTEADRDNNFGGQTLFFWGVSKPIVHKSAVYWGWNRVTRWGMPGVLVRSQGHFMRGENLLTERDPKKLRWKILPDSDAKSDEGLRAPKGPIAEEINSHEVGAVYLRISSSRPVISQRASEIGMLSIALRRSKKYFSLNSSPRFSYSRAKSASARSSRYFPVM